MNSTDLLPILAIETSGELCSVAVYSGENVYSEVNIRKRYVHSQKLFDLIEQAVNNLEIEKESLKSVAISVGPGSFTGLRIGMAAAKGIATGFNIPIIPVETFSAAAQWLHKTSPGLNKLALVNRVNSTELYLQKFDFSESTNPVSTQLDIILKSDTNKIDEDYKVFGNFVHPRITAFESPSAVAISEWAYIFGQDLVTFDYDYLEPNYVKKFIVRVNK